MSLCTFDFSPKCVCPPTHREKGLIPWEKFLVLNGYAWGFLYVYLWVFMQLYVEARVWCQVSSSTICLPYFFEMGPLTNFRTHQLVITKLFRNPEKSTCPPQPPPEIALNILTFSISWLEECIIMKATAKLVITFKLTCIQWILSSTDIGNEWYL